MPPILIEGVKAFEAFYHTKHSGRKLTFRPEYGNVEVRTRFKARWHDLTVTTHAMCVLALFETLGEDETISYKVSDRFVPASLELSSLTRALSHVGNL